MRRQGPDAVSQGEQSSIVIDGRQVPVTIRHHPRSRSISLRIDPATRGIKVTMPRWVRDTEAYAFIDQRTIWISERLAALTPASHVNHGAVIAYRGHDITVDWSSGHRRTPTLDEGMLRVGGEREAIGPRIQRWLQAEAKRLFIQDIADYCHIAGEHDVPSLGLSNARRRWGSCSTKGSIRLQWRLIMAPDHVRRAVVAHEVAHLRHMDHSAAFYDWLDNIYEGNRKVADAWLKHHGPSLYTVTFDRPSVSTKAS